MLTILLYVVIAIVIISIIATLLRSLGEFLLGIMGIGIILAVVVFLGPLIWGVVTKLFYLVLDFLPLTLVLVVGLAVLGFILEAAEKRKYRVQSQRIDQLGIEKIEGNTDLWKKMESLKLVELTAHGYAVSTAFYKKIVNSLENEYVLSQKGLEQHCVSCARQFQTSYLPHFSDFLQKKLVIFEFRSSSGESHFLSQAMMHRCENLFSYEGAATVGELLEAFRCAGILQYFPKDEKRITEFILSALLHQGKAQKIELDHLGEILYVSKQKRDDSKMVRREITVD